MKKVLILLLLFVLSSCSSRSQLNNDYSSGAFDTSYAVPILEQLASDKYEGREATTEGANKAALLITDKLKNYGLLPYGDNGTYYQNIVFNSSRLSESSMVLLVNENGENDTLKIGDDFVTMMSRSGFSNAATDPMPVVFAGYGIVADEYGYDDYTYIDPRNKIVVMVPGEPYSENEEFFDGSKPTDHSSPFTKMRTARQKGAAGVLLIPDDEYLSYWQYLRRSITNETLSIDEGTGESGIPAGLISIGAAKKIFRDESMSFETLESIMKNNELPEAFELSKKAVMDLKVISSRKNGKNIVALLPGNDPDLSDQYITLGAHYDHVGVTDGEVFNGADDNASGTTAVLESARLLSAAKLNSRPIIFILFTAEEKGLLGSKYFVDNFEPIDNILVNINVDMTGRESIDSIHVIGSNRVSGEFHEMIKKVNQETVNYYLDYSLSDTRLFRQSDHYSFAQKNIPVVFFFDNMRIDLHRPSDDVDKINFTKVCKTSHLISNLALEVANLNHRLK
ncbi:MAG: M20/M25/M40 family metallo-hydrolase [Melioribacteraceae bacterium]|nr:M20/M25/M40 family metallo-hydrolase [Melioribacteraceae bacterium]